MQTTHFMFTLVTGICSAETCYLPEQNNKTEGAFPSYHTLRYPAALATETEEGGPSALIVDMAAVIEESSWWITYHDHK